MSRFEGKEGAWFLEFLQNLPALAWAKDSEGRYVFVNAAAAAAFGASEDELIGRTDMEIFPSAVAEIFRRNDQLALEKGSALQTVEVLPDSKGVPRHSLVTKFPISAPDGTVYVAGTAIDITDRQTSLSHQEFLFGISESIRVATDPDQLMSETAAALGKFLKVDRCLFNEIDLSRDIELVRSEFSTGGASVIGQNRLSAYSSEARAQMQKGHPVINRDSSVDSRTAASYERVYGPAGERSYVAIPMMRNGQWAASLWCSSRSVRDWSEQEIQLIETVAERVWAAVERLRFEKRLKGNFDTFLGLIQSAPFGVYLVDSDFRLAQISEGSEKVFTGIDPLIGRDFEEVLRIIWPEPFASDVIKIFRNTLETGEPYRAGDTTEQRANQPIVESYDWQIKRVKMPDGTFGIVCYFYDLTELQQAQILARRAAFADAFRIRLSDTLRALSDPIEIQSAAARIVAEELDADRVAYFEVSDDQYVVARDYTRFGRSLVGTYPVAAFGEPTIAGLRSGRPLVSNDLAHSEDLTAAEKSAFAEIAIGAHIAVPLVKNGELVAGLTVQTANPRDWTEDQIALVEEAAERTWATLERARAEAALFRSEEKYRTLFESIDQGFTAIEVLFDEGGHPYDYRFLEANPAFKQQTGLENFIGKTMRDFAPDMEQFWFDVYGEVAITGEPKRFENRAEALGRDYEVYAFRIGEPGSNRVAVIFSDITERKLAEADRLFLATISEDLIRLSETDQILDVLGKKIGTYFRADRCTFTTINEVEDKAAVTHEWHRPDLNSIGGGKEYRISEFIARDLYDAARRGEVSVVNNTETDDRTEGDAYAGLSTRAYISVPFVSEGQWRFALNIASSNARDWTEHEVGLALQLTERIWTRLERARAEADLRRSEERFRVMIRNLPGGAAFVVDRDLRYVLADGEALESANVRREDLIGRTIYEVLPEDIVPEYEKNYRATLAGEQFNQEHYVHGRNFITRGTPLRNDRGEIYAVLAVSYDITERKASEMALQESEARFRSMADHAPVMIWVTNADGNCTYLSQSWYDFTGQTDETGLGLGWLNATHPEDREAAGEKFRTANENRDVFSVEYRLRRYDGEFRWAIDSAIPRVSESGDFLGYIGSVLDITDRKTAEEQLRASRDLNQSVIDSIPAHIAVLDPDGKITLVNSAWRKFASDNQGLIERSGLSVNYLTVCEKARDENSPDAAAIYDGIKSVLDREADSFTIEYPCHSPTADRWFLLTVSPLAGGGAVVAHLDTTDRRLVEEEIRKTAERLTLAQKAGRVGVWDWNSKGNETYWSDEMWALYGADPRDEDPALTFWPEHLHPADRDRTLGRVAELLAGDEKKYHDEFRIVRDDGEVRWIASSATVERFDDGKPARMYGVNIDITERKSIEERIRASEAQVRLITDSIPALVSYIDREYRYQFVNRRYTQWFGRAAEDILGQTMTEVLGEAAAVRVKPHADKALRGERVDFEAWLDYKGAGRRFVRVSYVPDLSQDGEIAGYYALVSDFTEQRRSEELLRSSEERMKVLTESFTDYAILSMDEKGVIKSWNPGATNIFGYSDEEIIGKRVETLYTLEDADKGVPEKEMRSARELGRALDERWHLRKGGSRFFASGVMAPLYEDDELIGYAKIATDLTEKRRQAEELQRAYEEMEIRVLERTQELASANESLIEQISERRSVERHRIRLLQSIVTTQEAERKRIARDIHDQLGQRLTALRLKLASMSELCVPDTDIHARAVRLQQIAELLDSEVGFLTWQLRPAALDELGLVAALATFVREWSRHYDKPAEFHAAGLNAVRLPSEVETQIYRITQEALNNITKHAEARSVSVILEKVGTLLVLIVEDDGTGFDPGFLERKQKDRHSMGLAGMKERAELIGGEVEVESARGSGTTIYVRIPLGDDSDEGLNNE